MSNPQRLPNSATKRKRSHSPIKYDASQHLPMASELALLGYLDVEIAEHIGISNGTYYNWKRAHVEFLEAIARARVPVDIEVTKALRLAAIGGMVTEEKAFKLRAADASETVTVVEVQRYVPGDTRAQIFWLKNRQPTRWRDYKQVESSGPDGAPIQHQVTSKGVEQALHRLIDMFGGKS